MGENGRAIGSAIPRYGVLRRDVSSFPQPDGDAISARQTPRTALKQRTSVQRPRSSRWRTRSRTSPRPSINCRRRPGSSPHVAGVAALYLSYNPPATGAQVNNAVTGGATPDKITSPAYQAKLQELESGQAKKRDAAAFNEN